VSRLRRESAQESSAGHQSSKCVKGDSTHAEWQKQPLPGQYYCKPLKVSDMVNHVSLYRGTEYLRSGAHSEIFIAAKDTLPLAWATKEKTDVFSARTGLRLQYPLITCIDCDETVCPTMHMTLGLGTGLVKHIYTFLFDYIEIEEPLAAQARKKLTLLQAQHEELDDAARAAPWGKKTVARKAAQEAKKKVTEQKSVYDEIFRTRADRSAQRALEDLLCGHGVKFEAFKTQSLVGDHVFAFLRKSKVILTEVEALFRNPQLRRAVTVEGLEDKITAFISQQKLLCSVYNILAVVMSRLTQSTQEEIDSFDLLAKYFAYLWRCAQYSVTPKLHLLEIHVKDDLQRYGSTGLFAEQVIEREHHNQHVSDIQFQCFKSWAQRNALIRERNFVHSSPDVQNIIRETKERNKKPVNKIKQEESEETKQKQAHEAEEEMTHIFELARQWMESCSTKTKTKCRYVHT